MLVITRYELRKIALGLGIAALSFAVHANYRCVGQDGKKYYGQAVPPQCVGVPVEQLNEAGRVVRRIEPHAAPPPAPPPDEAKLRAEAAAAKRDHALLATYASEAEIEDARQRALRATGSSDSAAINARYDADLKRYRELVQQRENARLLKPKPAPEPARPQLTREEQQAREAQEQARREARDMYLRETQVFREPEPPREPPRTGVSYIDPVRPTLSVPGDEGSPSILDRDYDEPGRPAYQPSLPLRR